MTHLVDELKLRFANGVDRDWPSHEFNALALAAFESQFRLIPAFRAYCEGRGRTPLCS